MNPKKVTKQAFYNIGTIHCPTCFEPLIPDVAISAGTRDEAEAERAAFKKLLQSGKKRYFCGNHQCDDYDTYFTVDLPQVELTVAADYVRPVKLPKGTVPDFPRAEDGTSYKPNTKRQRLEKAHEVEDEAIEESAEPETIREVEELPVHHVEVSAEDVAKREAELQEATPEQLEAALKAVEGGN